MGDDKHYDNEIRQLLTVGQQISTVMGSTTVSPLYMQLFMNQAVDEQRKTTETAVVGWPVEVQRVFRALQKLSISSVTRLYRVSPDYYAWPLYERALGVGAPSPFHLCKTVVMGNTRWRTGDSTPRYVCVVVQYMHTINAQALADEVRAMDGNKVPKKRFNFRLAEGAEEMTGFAHNGVAPVGMAMEIPVILCAAIAELKPPVLWVGAGAVDFKMAMPIDSFVAATACSVCDISVPL
ncbi:hypothetical protein EV175_002577 [Coemansia sp. RSA 1933]|nr:hypothetical protein EV175_002577 [Coemansia sp. RSA 1933]